MFVLGSVLSQWEQPRFVAVKDTYAVKEVPFFIF